MSFLRLPTLREGDLTLLLEGIRTADPTKRSVPSYDYELTVTGTSKRAGNICLRIEQPVDVLAYSGHIGYNVDEPMRGRRYARRGCRLLLPLARFHGIHPLLITCDPDNLPSRRTCEGLGAILQDIVPVPTSHPLHAAGHRVKCRYLWSYARDGITDAAPQP